MCNTLRAVGCVRFVCLLLVAVMPACTPPPAPVSPSPFPPTLTAPPPTRTAIPTAAATPQPTASPVPQRAPEPVDVPACTGGAKSDSPTLYELLNSFGPDLLEADSFQYRTLYRYTLGNRYADGELSVDVSGTHQGRLARPDEDYDSPLASHAYERSHVTLTDLRTGLQTETIVARDGAWVRQADQWLAFDGDAAADLTNLGDLFTPQLALFGYAGIWLGFADADQAKTQTETLANREVTHRCWALPAMQGEINAYIEHIRDIYTYLSSAEFHLWTAEDDTELVQFAVTGKHVGECAWDGCVTHDAAPDFLLLMELSNADGSAKIASPTRDQIVLTIPDDAAPVQKSSTPFNDLPLPPDAEEVEASALPTDQAGNPREFSLANYDTWDYLHASRAENASADRRPVYETRLTLAETAAFFLNEMGQRGWQLTGEYVHLGWTTLGLGFERDGLVLPVILETRQPNITRISAILPRTGPDAEASLTGWTLYTSENSGLSDDWITALAIDQQGQTWVGTHSGLIVFDGEAWTAITAEDMHLPAGESEFTVGALATDEQGRVWVGTDQGLSVLADERWTTHGLEALQLPRNDNAWLSVDVLTVDDSGHVWFRLGASFDELVLSVFDGEGFTHYQASEVGMPSGHRVNVITEDQHGHIWIGTSGGGIYTFDGEHWSTVQKALAPPNTSYGNREISDLAVDQRGWVWVGTQEGLSVFDGETWITYTPDNSSMPDQWVEAIAIDGYDRVWVGGYSGEVSALESDGTWHDYTPLQAEAADSSGMAALVVDAQGRVWAGANGGLNVFDAPVPMSTVTRVLPNPTPLPPAPTPMPTPDSGWTSYTTDNSGLVNNQIRTMTIDAQGQVWAGTAHGVSVFGPSGEWTTYRIANADLLSDLIEILVFDEQGTMWIGTNYGLTTVSADGNWVTYAPENSDLPYQVINTLLVDNEGRAWIANNCSGSCNALSVLAPDGTWTNYTSENSPLPDLSINVMAQDEQGQLWFGTAAGVSVLASDGQWSSYTAEDLGLTDGLVFVFELAVDEQGRVWMGTSGNGLIVLAPDGSQTTYNTANSDLVSDYVSALMFDDGGRLWIGTDSGVSVFAPDGRWETYTVDNSGLIYGGILCFASDSQGRVWIGTELGLSVLTP